MLNAYPVRDLARSSALGLGTVLAATLGLAEVLPEVTTAGLVTPDQGIDPLIAHAYPCQGRYEATDLFGTPLLTKPAGDGGDHAGQAVRPLPAVRRRTITEGLGLLGIIATSGSIAAKLTADQTAVETSLLPICRWLMPKS